MVAAGMRYDVLPGEWWGPSTASYVLRDLCKVHRLAYEGPIAVHVTQSECVYISEVENLCSNISLNDCLLGLTEHAAAINHSNIQRVNSRFDLMGRNTAPSGPSGDGSSKESGPALVEAFFDPLFHQPPSAINPWVSSLLLLMPLRLGVNGVNAPYITAIKEMLRTEWCMGFIGGKVGHAIYFAGYDEAKDYLFGLDPHVVFPTPSESELTGMPPILHSAS